MFALAVSLFSLSIFTTINKNLKDVPSTMNFMENAGVYNNLSTIAKLQIQSYYPEQIQNNILVLGLANKLVETVVTPGLVEKAALPAVKASFAFAKAPTDIVNDKVVVETGLYKQQALDAIAGLGLPNLLVINANLLINSIPPQINLVDLQKRPNNALGMVVKVKELFAQNRQNLQTAWIVMWVSLILLIVNGMRHLKHLIKTLWMGIGIVSIMLILIYYLRPYILSVWLPSSVDAIGDAQNQLISDAVAYFLWQVRSIAFYYLGISVICFFLWKFVNWDKTQNNTDRFLRKIHIPTISVKVN